MKFFKKNKLKRDILVPNRLIIFRGGDIIYKGKHYHRDNIHLIKKIKKSSFHDGYYVHNYEYYSDASKEYVSKEYKCIDGIDVPEDLLAIIYNITRSGGNKINNFSEVDFSSIKMLPEDKDRLYPNLYLNDSPHVLKNIQNLNEDGNERHISFQMTRLNLENTPLKAFRFNVGENCTIHLYTSVAYHSNVICYSENTSFKDNLGYDMDCSFNHLMSNDEKSTKFIISGKKVENLDIALGNIKDVYRNQLKSINYLENISNIELVLKETSKILSNGSLSYKKYASAIERNLGVYINLDLFNCYIMSYISNEIDIYADVDTSKYNHKCENYDDLHSQIYIKLKSHLSNAR